MEKKIVRLLDRCLSNLMSLADGVTVEVADGDEEPKVYTRPPDRAANEYILNRILGRPASRKPLGDPAPTPPPKLDLTKIPLDRLETMERWLNEADGETVDESPSVKQAPVEG